jgi:hypothetical protein
MQSGAAPLLPPTSAEPDQAGGKANALVVLKTAVAPHPLQDVVLGARSLPDAHLRRRRESCQTTCMTLCCQGCTGHTSSTPHPYSRRSLGLHLCIHRNNPASWIFIQSCHQGTGIIVKACHLKASVQGGRHLASMAQSLNLTCSPPSMRAPSGCSGLVFPVLVSAILSPGIQKVGSPDYGVSLLCTYLHRDNQLIWQHKAAMAQLQSYHSDRWLSTHRLLQSKSQLCASRRHRAARSWPCQHFHRRPCCRLPS